MTATHRTVHFAFPTLLSRYALEAAAAADQPSSSWIQVAVVGDFESPVYGKFAITTADLSQMQANFSTGKFPVPPTEICMDYDHLSMRPKVPGDGKAAGWFKELALREDGTELWARIEWTSDGAEAIRKKEYQFVSPSFDKAFETNEGEDIGCTLLAAAVTNHPFLQGMEAMSLSARPAGTPKVVMLATFSDDERRDRVAQAVRVKFGDWPSPGYYDPCDYYCGPWVNGLWGDTVVFEKGGRKYQVAFAIGDDGVVTFSGEPVEIVLNPEPLAAPAAQLRKETSMKVISLTSTDNKPVQIDEAALETTELVKSLRAQLPGKDAKVVNAADFDAMSAKVTSLSASVETLTTGLTAEKTARETAETALATDRAKAKVLSAITAGKITPAQKEWAEGYALSQPAEFDKFLAAAPVVVTLGRTHGSGEGGATGTGAEAQLEAKAKDIQASQKVTYEKAYDLAMQANPELYAQAERERELVAK